MPPGSAVALELGAFSGKSSGLAASGRRYLALEL